MRTSIIQVAAVAVAATATAVDAAPVRAAVDNLERRFPNDFNGAFLDSIAGMFKIDSKPKTAEVELSLFRDHGRHDYSEAAPKDTSVMQHDELHASSPEVSKVSSPRERRARQKELRRTAKETEEKTAKYHTAILNEWLKKGLLGIEYSTPGVRITDHQARKRAQDILRLGEGKEGYELHNFGSRRGADHPVSDLSKEHLMTLLKEGGLLLWKPPRELKVPREILESDV